MELSRGCKTVKSLAVVRYVAQLTSFSVVASCGLLPRTTRPGPRVRTAFWSVASPHPREASVARALAVAPHSSRRSRRSRPGPGLAGVAKREDSYGPKSGPYAGARASSPGEQAAACDYRKTRELGYKTRELGCARISYRAKAELPAGMRPQSVGGQ